MTRAAGQCGPAYKNDKVHHETRYCSNYAPVALNRSIAYKSRHLISAFLLSTRIAGGALELVNSHLSSSRRGRRQNVFMFQPLTRNLSAHIHPALFSPNPSHQRARVMTSDLGGGGRGWGVVSARARPDLCFCCSACGRLGRRRAIPCRNGVDGRWQAAHFARGVGHKVPAGRLSGCRGNPVARRGREVPLTRRLPAGPMVPPRRSLPKGEQRALP